MTPIINHDVSHQATNKRVAWGSGSYRLLVEAII
jgi:hypothetical protein